MVLVHGSPDRRGAFRRIIRHLPDLRIVTYDRRGYGESADLAPARSLDDHAHDLLDVLNGRSATVVGHSFGANVTMLASTIAPDRFASIGVYEPSMCWLPGWDPDHIDQVRAMACTDDHEALGEQMGRLFLDSRWDELGPKEQRIWRREGLALSLDMSFILHEPYDVSKVSSPAIAGIGELTTGPHLSGGYMLADALGVEATLVPEASHLAHLQAPAAWAGFVREAVAKAH